MQELFQLTDEMKKKIDDMSYQAMLAKWRFAPIGDPFFRHGPVFDYFNVRMQKLRAEDEGQERHVAASKAIGWD